MILVPCFLFTKGTPYPSYPTLAPCIGTALFIASQRPRRTSLGWLLASRALVFVGKMSYSWYLWHWPVYILFAYTTIGNKLDPGMTVLGLVVSFAAGAVSYLVVEPVFRDRKKVKTKPFLLGVTLVWTSLLVFSLVASLTKVGGIGYAGGGSVTLNTSTSDNGSIIRSITFQTTTGSSTGSNSNSNNNNTAGNSSGSSAGANTSGDSSGGSSGGSSSGGSSSGGSGGGGCMVYRSDAEIDSAYRMAASSITVNGILASRGWEAGRFSYRPRNAPYYAGGMTASDTPSVVVIGTSHAEMYLPVIEKLAAEYGKKTAFIVQGGTPSGFFPTGTRTNMPTWDATRLAHLDRWSLRGTIDLIVWIDFWGGDSKKPWWYEGHDFEYSLKLMGARATRVVVLGDVPLLPITPTPSNDLFKLYVYKRYNAEKSFDFLVSLKEDPGYKERRERIEAIINTAAVRLSNEQAAAAAAAAGGAAGEGGGGGGVGVAAYRFVEVAPYFVEKSTGFLQVVSPDTGGLVYKDWGHLNLDGAPRVEQLLRKEVYGQTICP